MKLTTSNLVAWHGLTSAQHRQKRDHYAEKGFRPLSISVYGTPSSPRYAAVMVKRPNVIATRSFIDQSHSEFQATFSAQADDGFGPFLISATGPQGGAIFASSFRKMDPIPLTRHALTKQAFIDLNAAQKDAGRILIAADVYGTPEHPLYCGIWVKNPDLHAWNVDAVDEPGDTLQQRFEAMRAVGARPGLISVTPAGRHLEMFVDSGIGKWDSRVGMTPDQYQARFSSNADKGLLPIVVSASGTGSGARFAAIYASRDDVDERTFRAKGGIGIQAIDDKIKAYMKDRHLRGVALAIGHGTRLLYARGYTLAEPGYPDVQPTTVFRQASVSKVYCGIAVWKLIEMGKLTLNTTLQSVLNLKTPDGDDPADDRFADVTVDHLLGSRSGIKQGGVWGSVDANAAFDGTLPSNGTEVARWIASLDMTGDPGDTTNSVYGNTDYYLLSLIVAKKMNVSTFEAALKTLVLDPLKMTRTRGCTSLAGERQSDEALHHLAVHDPENGWALHQLQCERSLRSDERPLVQSNYGGWDLEMFDGCGGLSAAVVDVARLCAMLSFRSSSPVLKPETIDAMFAACIACGSQTGPDGKGSHGYHGFDWAKTINAAQHRVQYSKGGWLPGQGTVATGTTNGFFYVIAQNGNGRKGATVKWLDEIEDIVETRDWGTTNLFPNFGMPAFLTLAAAPFARAPSLAVKAQDAFRLAGQAMAHSRRILPPPPRPPVLRPGRVAKKTSKKTAKKAGKRVAKKATTRTRRVLVPT